MKKEYCTKHQLRHGRKYLSCAVIEEPTRATTNQDQGKECPVFKTGSLKGTQICCQISGAHCGHDCHIGPTREEDLPVRREVDKTRPTGREEEDWRGRVRYLAKDSFTSWGGGAGSWDFTKLIEYLEKRDSSLLQKIEELDQLQYITEKNEGVTYVKLEDIKQLLEGRK